MKVVLVCMAFTQEFRGKRMPRFGWSSLMRLVKSTGIVGLTTTTGFELDFSISLITCSMDEVSKVLSLG